MHGPSQVVVSRGRGPVHCASGTALDEPAATQVTVRVRVPVPQDAEHSPYAPVSQVAQGSVLQT
jgi:hypothetical protein